MKIICIQENLLKALSAVNHIATKNSTLPILNNVNIHAEERGIQFSTTNLEIGVHYWIRGKIETKGAFTVNAKLLSDYVSLLPKENIEIELSDNELHLKTSKAKTKLKGEVSDNFPIIPSVEKKDGIAINKSVFSKAINKVIFAASNNKIRPELNGIYFQIHGNKLTLAATDSYRLSETVLTLSKSMPEMQQTVIIPTSTLQEVMRIFGNENDDRDIEVFINDNQILFSTENIEIISRVIAGQYPDYKQIIPTEFKTRIMVNKDEFMNAIKRAALFSSFENNDVIIKAFPGKKIFEVYSVSAPIGENITEVETQSIEGDENEITFNHRYILSGMNVMDGNVVDFRLVDKNIPGVMRENDNDGFLYIIMPIKA